MAGRRDDGTDIIGSGRSVPRSDERIFILDLAQFLHHRAGVLRRFARKHGYLRKVGLGIGRDGVHYVSVYAAMRIIAYIRAIQGEQYLNGKNFHEERQKRLEYGRKRSALQSRGPQQMLHPQRGTGPVPESVGGELSKETPAVWNPPRLQSRP